jgi:hypothetical protein
MRSGQSKSRRGGTEQAACVLAAARAPRSEATSAPVRERSAPKHAAGDRSARIPVSGTPSSAQAGRMGCPTAGTRARGGPRRNPQPGTAAHAQGGSRPTRSLRRSRALCCQGISYLPACAARSLACTELLREGSAASGPGAVLHHLRVLTAGMHFALIFRAVPVVA